MPFPLTGKRAICASLPGGALPGMGALRRSVPTRADLVEIRIDLLDEPGRLEDLVTGWPRPVVATCRRASAGGRFRGSEEERFSLLQRAAVAGAGLVDLEHDALDLARRPGWPRDTRFIFSRHDTTGLFSGGLEAAYRELAARGPYAVKLVPTAASISDGVLFLEGLRNLSAGLGPGDPVLSAFCMGEAGIFTRILAFTCGASLVYAAFSHSTPVAPGQLAVDELSTLYRAGELGDDTCFSGVLGSRVSASLSPLIHNHVYRLLGMDRCYLPLAAVPDDLPRLLERLASGRLPFRLAGLSVTAPYKMAVLPFIDELSPRAGRAGAVNTVVRRADGRLRGFNTDAHGIRETIRAKLGRDLSGRRALVLGAGGGARAAALALDELGMGMAVANRTARRARDLAAEWGGEGGGLDRFTGERFDLVINAASAPGSIDSGAPPFRLNDGGTAIFDLNYHPPLSPLLAAGARLGCPILDGLQMLACQAERQFRLFTGRRAPFGAMLDMLRAMAGGPGQ